MEADIWEDELEEAGVGTTAAAIVALAFAMLLIGLPVAVALQAPALPEGWLIPVGSFALAVLGLKLGAIAWGVAKKLSGAYPTHVVTENAD